MGVCNHALTLLFESFGDTTILLEWFNNHGMSTRSILCFINSSKHFIIPTFPCMLTHVASGACIFHIKKPAYFCSAIMSSALECVCNTSVGLLNLWDRLKEGIYG